MTQKSYRSRRMRVAAQLAARKVDGFLTTALPNVRYLSGFTGSNAAVLVHGNGAVLFTDPRYETQAPAESDCTIRVEKGPLLRGVAAWLHRHRTTRLGFESNRIAYADYQFLRQETRGVKLRPVSYLVEDLRQVKEAAEIDAIRHSVRVASAALDRALRSFRDQMSEREMAAEIDFHMRGLGAEGSAFETIVASGGRAALPHARPTDRPVQVNALLLIDMGASVAGYASDMTRTLLVGKPRPKALRLYRAVLESQLAALDVIRPGVACRAVDRAARRALRRHGLDTLFVHSTGHGLGLEIHEAPRIGKNEARPLQEGMVITVEPGVYDPDFGGVRIEDTVAVTKTGCEVLTPTTKELRTL